MISPDQKGNIPTVEQLAKMPTSSSTKSEVSTKESTDDGRKRARHVGPPKYNGNGESRQEKDHTRSDTKTDKGIMITDTLSYDDFCKANPLWETHGGKAADSAPAFDPAEPTLVGFRGQMAP